MLLTLCLLLPLAGKLFPGPHLFAGAGIVALWALAASLVPAMQKGNDTARSAHIALNTLNLGLFIWQVRYVGLSSDTSIYAAQMLEVLAVSR